MWRAEDVLLRRLVAVKEVHLPSTLDDEERRVQRERVLREARSAAAVRHPVLVTVFDVVEDGDRPWIVLELVEAQTLAARIREQTLSPQQAARVGLDLLAALAAVHRAGIQHRDVKPGNVLIEDDGRPRLTDFGIASSAGDASLTSTGVLLGSPSYLPPERARGESGGPSSDLWGLAATLYTAVEGKPPYEGEHPLAVLTAVVEGRRRPAERAGALEPLLADLLDAEPQDRPDAAEVRRRLVEVAGPDLGRLLLDPTRSPGLDDAGHDGPGHDGPGPGDAATDLLGVAAGKVVAGTSTMTAGPAPGTASAGSGSASGSGSGSADVDELSRTSSLAATSAPAPASDPLAAAAAGAPDAGAPRRRRRPRRARLGVLALVVLALVAALAVTALVVTRLHAAGSGGGSAAQPAASGSAVPASPQPVAFDATADTAPTPAGWVRYRDPAGWSVAHPTNWRQTRLGEQGVDFVEPGTGSYLHVQTSSTAPVSVLRDWESQEQSLVPRVSNYARVAMTPTDGGDGSRAADWEFRFELAGSALRAVDRGLVAAGTGYTLYWQTPAAAWDGSQPTLTGLFSSFATR
ncbi:MAG: eukaryotic-like serine/threonine-protein kinase [Frankiaceae bacterium]|nr:eukaryotic-like serine/threonine-protein kinase [Frankiaceae bacterium]